MRHVDRERQALQIFTATCALPEEERAALIEARCAGDVELKRRVEQMLRADASTRGPVATEAKVDRFMADQVRRVEPELEARDPEVEGHYTILRIIGEGGMGTVYEAQQHRPQRRVAIKAIRPGRITPQMRKRFDYEAQVLGRLEHPGIARLYEADTQTEDGRIRAFLAMELVIGEPIDLYATIHRLDVAGKLRLFIKVCEAIAYAHRMGVIHRDLKPANILVNVDGQPKVLDFGVARTIGEDVSTMLTQHGQIVGTLAYMSPEQVEGRPDIDTRTDVYSLGVLLFKLLTGAMPIRLDDAGLAAATEKLLNETPPRLGQFDKRLKGDLEVIVARALEKDRSRRYASVEQLCAEIDRFLTGRPIEARGDSALYLIRKVVWRHRAIVGVGAGLIVLLAAFGIYASATARHNRRLADAALRSEGLATSRAAQLRQSLYFSSIGFAQSAMENNDIERVHTLLDGCDADLRGWEWAYLKRLCDLSSRTRDLRLDRPRYASFSTDKSVAAYASLGREIVVVDQAAGREILRRTIAEGTTRVALDGDGRYVAFGGTVGNVELVDLQTGKSTPLAPDDLIATSEATRALRVVGFTPDGRSLVVGGLDGQVRVWDVATATRRLTFARGPALPICMILPPGGDVAVIGDNQAGLSAYDLATGQVRRVYSGHDAPVWSLALSADGTMLASGDNDARLIVWNLATGDIVTQLDTNDGWLTALAFNHDGSMLAEGRADSTVRLLHLPDAGYAGVLRGHRHAAVHVDFEPDGTLQTVSIDGTAKTWGPASARGVPTIESGSPQTIGLAFSPDGSALLAGGGDGTIRAWRLDDLREGLPLTSHVRLPDHPSTVLEIAVDPRHDRVCTTSRDGMVRLSGRSTGAPLRTLVASGPPAAAAAFSPDGSRLLVGSEDGLTLYDADSGAALKTWSTPGHAPNEARFDAAGRSFYTAGSDGAVRRYDLAGDAAPVARADVDRGGAYELCLSPDGRLLAVAGDTGSVTLLDAQTLQTVRSFVGHQGPVVGVAFHPSGQRLATCGNDRAIRIWDVETGTEVLTLRGHRRIVQQLQFSPDGHTLASTSDDGTIRLWKGPADKR